MSKSKKITVSTNTNPEGAQPLSYEASKESSLNNSQSNLLGIQSIADLKSQARDGIRKSIQEFITQSKSTSKSTINLKSYYVGKYRNPHFGGETCLRNPKLSSSFQQLCELDKGVQPLRSYPAPL